MAKINVKISVGGNTIEAIADSFEYKFDDLDDNGYDKNNSYLIKVKFSGDITENTKGETLKFLEWSIEENKDVYRDMEATILGTNNEMRRIYELKGAFIADYIEEFGIGKDGKEVARYTVNLIQRKEKTDKENVKFYSK